MGEQQVSSLSYSVRGMVVLKYFGQLCIVFSLLTCCILAVSLFFTDYSLSIRYSIIILLVAVLGFLLNNIKASSNIQPNEALVISALIFIFVSVVMTYPLMTAGLSFEDAFFESVSSVTTTGLSTLSSVEDKPPTFHFARSWMQWTGGLGIVVLSIALLVRPGRSALRLMGIENIEDILGGTRANGRKVLKVYLILSFLGIIMLFLSGVHAFPAVVHTLAAVSTGGFSSYDNSIAGLGGTVSQFMVSIVSLSGAVTLSVYYLSARGGVKKFVDNVEVRYLLLLVLVVTAILSVFISGDGRPITDAVRNSFFLAVSAQTTAGFSALNIVDMSPGAKLILIFSMAVGGSAGSTAGGMKLFRLIIMIRMLKLTIVRTCLSQHAVVEPRLAGQRLERNEIEEVLLLILFFIIVMAGSWVPFVIMGYDPLNSLFDVVSATCTVGLSTGIASSQLPAFLKGILCADMLMGRLEIIAFLVILYPRTWVGRRIM